MLRRLFKWETVVKLFLMIFCGTVIIEMYLLSKKTANELEEEENSFSLKDEKSLMDWELPSAPSTGQWQPVMGTRFKFYVYSAHYDRRVKTQVQVIGATRPNGGSVVCTIFPSGNKSHYTFVPATVKPFDSQASLPYSAVSITCPLPPDSPLPMAVSVISESLPHISNLLSVQSEHPQLPQNAFSVVACVEPIDRFYSQTMRLIEFIEMNRLLGVNHFMFYNQSVTPEISCLLQHYVQQGIATVLPWEFGFWSRNIKKDYHGQSVLAAANDCLHRSGKFGYAVFLGVDQFLVPRNTNTIQEFIESKRETVDLSQTGAFSISNVNFYQEWPDHDWKGDMTLSHYMMTMMKTRRTEPNSADSPKYSTLVSKPHLTLGIHQESLPGLVSGQNIHKTDESEILSHLYVSCESANINCSSVPSVLDTTLERYKHKLNLAMLSTWRNALPTCTLHDEEASINYEHHVPVLTN